jgi:ABC-2 type transport system permease protein
LIALLHGELIKVRTTRTALGFATASLLLVLAWVIISILADDPSTVSQKRDALNISPLGLTIPLLLFGIVGATGEYRHRTIAPAVLIAPDRVRLPLARLLAYVLTALGLGAAMVLVALVIGLLLLSSQSGPDLESADYARVIGGALIVAALTAALGCGVGVLVRNQVAGVVGALIWVLVLAPLLGLIDDRLPSYTTIVDAAVVVGGSASDGRPLSWGGAVAVLAAWALVFNVLGLFFEKRRDID